MKLDVYPDAATVAQQAADQIAVAARAAIAARGKFVIAVSGGTTPWQMLRLLAKEDLPWEAIHFVQVDERIAPAGDKDRNLTHLQEALSSQRALPAANIHAMPVNAADVVRAANDYTNELHQLAGSPPVIDLVHLGMGPDGHTASLIPGDPVLNVADRDVALCGEYQGRQRMTLTYPVLNRARQILWIITGTGKKPMLDRLLAGDRTIPAGCVNRDHATVLTDTAAADSPTSSTTSA